MKTNRACRLYLLLILLISLILSSCADSSSGNSARENSSGKDDAEYSGAYIEIPEDTLLISYEDDIDALMDAIGEAVDSCQKKICIRGWLPLDTTDFYRLPYGTFWLKGFGGTSSWTKRKGEENKTTYAFYELEYYDLTLEEIEAMKQQIDAQADEIISKIPEGADPWMKIKTVHDELCALITYDQTLEAEHCHDTYGALVNHNAVCSGYACAFSYIMNKMGDYCALSYSDVHAWNAFAVSSNEIYVDTTWDDTDMCDRYGNPYIDYSYFFLTREECESIDSHSIESMDPYLSMSDPENYNYHSHEGYLADSYDQNAINEMMKRQYDAGSNTLTVRFSNKEDYDHALSSNEDGTLVIYDVLNALEYYDVFYIWNNDAVQTVTIGLYADNTSV